MSQFQPSSRQAELEELRQRGTVNTNATALAENATAPTNMADWQAKQKALKQAERESKTQSADMLHNFNNTNVASSALHNMKQEEREKQRTAQQQLHNYRAAFHGRGKGGDGSKSDMNADDSGGGDETRSGINVAGAVASLNAPGEELDAPTAGRIPSFARDGAAAAEEFAADDAPRGAFTEFVQHASDVVPPPAVPAPAADDSFAMVEKPVVEPAVEPVQEPSAMEPPAPEKPIAEPAVVPKDDWVSVPSESTEPTQQEPYPEFGSNTAKHSNITDMSSTFEDVKVHIDFSFALVTRSDTPATESYLQAASFIVGPAASGPATLKAVNFVKEKNGVKRFMVSASLPLQMQGLDKFDESRQHVLGLLRTSVTDGSFYSLASAS